MLTVHAYRDRRVKERYLSTDTTCITSPVPSKPAAVSGVSVDVAVWIMARAAASSSCAGRLGAILSTSCLLARKDTRPMKHATCSSVASSSPCPPAPLPKYRRWSMPDGKNIMNCAVEQVHRNFQNATISPSTSSTLFQQLSTPDNMPLSRGQD